MTLKLKIKRERDVNSIEVLCHVNWDGELACVREFVAVAVMQLRHTAVITLLLSVQLLLMLVPSYATWRRECGGTPPLCVGWPDRRDVKRYTHEQYFAQNCRSWHSDIETQESDLFCQNPCISNRIALLKWMEMPVIRYNPTLYSFCCRSFGYRGVVEYRNADTNINICLWILIYIPSS